MAYIMSFDQGTTSSRAVIFDDKGQVVAIAQKEFKQYFPKPGLVEHDAMEIWATQMGVAQEVLTKANLKSTDIAAIGITNQRETIVIWEKSTGRPIHHAIVWQDRRTSAYTTSLKEQGHEPMITKKTGLVADPYFSGTKIKWILDNVEGAREKAKRGELLCGTIDTWLIWKLTEGAAHVTDVSNASRTLLLNIHTVAWDDELLALFDIPKSLLPSVVSSSAVVGHATKDAFQGASVPIAGIAGDQQAATFGQACYDVGMAKNTYGTGCFMLMNVGTAPVPSQNKLLSTILWQTGNGVRYALEGSVFVGGAVVQWLRDGLRIIHKSSEVEDLSNKVADNGGVYFVPAFTGLGTPHWDPYARGAILGITRGTTGGHIARAALESIAYQSAEVLVAMQRDAHTPLTQLRVDGGATQNDFLMQFQTDLLRVPVIRAKVQETTALGACYLAGLAIGLWKDEGEINALWKADKEFMPIMSEDQSASLKDNWSRAVARSLDWAREV